MDSQAPTADAATKQSYVGITLASLQPKMLHAVVTATSEVMTWSWAKASVDSAASSKNVILRFKVIWRSDVSNVLVRARQLNQSRLNRITEGSDSRIVQFSAAGSKREWCCV